MTILVALDEAPAQPLEADVLLLDDAERARAAAFRFDEHRAAYVRAHALARRLVGEVVGVRAERLRLSRRCRRCGCANGKPHVPGQRVDFSLSHAGRLVAVAVCTNGRVGIDVESLRTAPNRVAAVARRTCSQAELRAVMAAPDPARAFAVAWTRKEALAKGVGAGLAMDFRRLECGAGDGRRTVEVEGARWIVGDLDGLSHDAPAALARSVDDDVVRVAS